jgi:hypothetical protein
MKVFKIFLIFLFLPLSVFSHSPNQSYIYLQIYESAVTGRFEITIKDINTALGFNINEDATLEEIRPFLPQIKKYYLERASFRSELGDHKIEFTETNFLSIKKIGKYILLEFDLENMPEVPDELTANYSVLFDKKLDHKSLLMIEYNWTAGIHNNEYRMSASFENGDTENTFSLKKSSIFNGFTTMISLGMWHIWAGLDHILFLLALILPAVLRRVREDEVVDSKNTISISTKFIKANWVPVDDFKTTLFYVLKLITFFTIAHALTLTVVAFNVLELPSNIFEAIIALSISVSAFHILKPLFKRGDWVIAFCFGIFHGFGFAEILLDIGLRGEYMALSLLGFNLGVELGHVVIIVLVLPILYVLRKRKIYSKILLYGSIFLILIGLYWFVTRLFDFSTPVDVFLDKAVRKVNIVIRNIFT